MKVGLASARITPRQPVWMAGFAARTKPSEGKYQDLFAKAAVFSDDSLELALITADVVAFDDTTVVPVRRRIQRQYGIPPERLMLCASHTHCGPVVRDPELTSYPERDEQWFSELHDTLVHLVGEARDNLQEARLGWGVGSCTLAVNRRRVTPSGTTMQPNPDGPTDPDVPVLRIADPDGGVRGLLFSLACHPTTRGEYLLGGDYPGFAQAFLEQEFKGASALFIAGCHGDQKPRSVGPDGSFKPGTVEVVKGLGRELSQAVLTRLAGPLEPVDGPLGAAAAIVDLPFQNPPTRQELEAHAAGENKWRKRWAEHLLALLDSGKGFPTSRPLEVQVFHLGDLTVASLGGEVCVGIGLRLKRELADRKLLVAAYTNSVAGYIPNKELFPEGGYEVDGSYFYGPWPAPYVEDIDDRIIATVKELVEQRRG